MIEQYMCWSLVVQARGLSPRHPRATWVAAESISSSREFFFRIPNALSIVPRNSNLTPHALGRTDVNAFSYRRVEHRGARRIIFEADKADPLRYRRQRCLRLDPNCLHGRINKVALFVVRIRAGSMVCSFHPTYADSKATIIKTSRIPGLPQSRGMQIVPTMPNRELAQAYDRCLGIPILAYRTISSEVCGSVSRNMGFQGNID